MYINYKVSCEVSIIFRGFFLFLIPSFCCDEVCFKTNFILYSSSTNFIIRVYTVDIIAIEMAVWQLCDAVGNFAQATPPILRLWFWGPPATMDRLESLSSTLQSITMYDIKSMYNQVCPLTCFKFLRNLLTTLTHQAKNVVLNISEMEAKVREATNDDPWCVKLLCYQESWLKIVV